MTSVILTPNDVASSLQNTEFFSRKKLFTRGHGLFSFLSNHIIPIAKQVGRYLLTKGKKFVNHTGTNLASGKPFLESLREGGFETLRSVGEDLSRVGRGIYKKRKRRPFRNIFDSTSES